MVQVMSGMKWVDSRANQDLSAGFQLGFTEERWGEWRTISQSVLDEHVIPKQSHLVVIVELLATYLLHILGDLELE